MKWVKGNKTIEISVEEVVDKVRKFSSVHIDLGTGDGRFVYELALKNPNTLYIGIDPVKSQMREYSVKCVRKKLDNVLYIVSSIENLTTDLKEIADKITVILPWGSLLGQVLKPSKETVMKLENLLKANGELDIVLGYSVDLEPSEASRLELPEFSEKTAKDVIVMAFERLSRGLRATELEVFSKGKLADIGSNWAKRLTFGRYRQMYRMKFRRAL